jgi:hypothetical protein
MEHGPSRSQILVGSLVLIVMAAILFVDWRYISWDHLKASAEDLRSYTHEQYLAAVLLFIVLTSSLVRR